MAATAAAFAFGGVPSTDDLLAFALLTAGTATAQLFNVRLGRNHSFSTGMLFVAAGVVLLPPELVAAMALIQLIPEWVKERYSVPIQTFNIANYLVDALAAWGAAQIVLTVGPIGGNGRWALAGLAAVVVLVATNHLLLATMLRFARGHSFRQSGLFSLESLATDLAVASLGLAFAVLWMSNPWIAPALLVPLVLSHRTLKGLELVRESEERLQTMFDSAAVGTALLDADGRMVASNRALVTLLGYTTAELALLPFRTYSHPDDVAQELKLYAELFAGERDEYRLEKRFLAKDGHVVWTQVVVGLVRNADGRPEYAISMVEDITERHAAERAVRESEERYRELFENANDMIATIDLDSRITSVNAAFERILGYTREEVLGLQLKDVMPLDSAAKAYGTRDVKVDGEAERTTYQIDFKKKDGQRVPIEVSSRVVCENGEPVGIQAFLRDLSERHKLEDQLRQAQKMEAVGRLAGGIAHDFNNLLTAISGYSSFALERLDAGGAVDRRDLVEVKAAAERAAALTGQLLAFSRKQILQPKLVDANELVRNLDRMLRRLIHASIEIETDLDSTNAFVRADPTQLEQVLLNLVVNARDAMQDGGTLTITTDTVDVGPNDTGDVPEGTYVVLSVCDTGTGIDDETKARLFEPFFTTKEVGKGTGLGLAMVYGFVKQSGGYVTVESEAGRGATFRIFLQPAEGEAAAPERKTDAPQTSRGTGRILLVEDEEIVRRLVRQMLEHLGYDVVEAQDGERAVELAGDGLGHVDLLLTDAVMPKLGGPAVAEHLRKQYPELKVVFMSGYTEEAIVSHGTNGSGANFLQKPFTSDELATKVLAAFEEPPVRLAVAG